MQCEALTASGQRCRGNALHGETRCLLHSGVARELGRKGAQSSKRSNGLKKLRRPRTPVQVQRLLSQCIVEVREDRLDWRKGATITNAANALLRAIKLTDHESRLRLLEAVTKKENGQSRM